ncbi:MAG TPA: hypothetical protein VGN57_11820 [Pirellulaceae bacterium]|jgi:hypothetical protein|nr:hypothetical protein [Pirellulaceae bacterium]
MRSTLLLILSLVALALVTGGPIAEVAAQKELDAFQLAAGEGVVVLKNGRTVRGSVTRLGDHLLIQLAAGGEIRVPVGQSLVIAESLEEAYEIRRDGLLPAAVDDRAKLVEWCLQEDLVHRAADQVLALSKIDPRHPRLPQLERRLQARAKASAPTLSAARPVEAGFGNVTPATAFVPEPSVDPRTYFAEKVQAQVVFGCAAARCHGGPLGGEFRLRPYPIAVRPVDEITDENFAAVRKFLGDGGPHSLAVRYATRAHAGPPADRVRDLLVQLAQALDAAGSGSSAATAERSPHSSPPPFGDGSGVRTAGFAEGAASRPAEINPYDPAEFNRRYHGRVEPPAMP